MNYEQKLLLFQMVTPTFFLSFSLFARFVWNRLELKMRKSWLLFCAGAYTALLGLSIAVFLTHISFGASLVAIGVFIAAVGLAVFLVSIQK